MRLSSRTWFGISLALLVGAALFARLGNSVRDRQKLSAPRVLKPSVALSPSGPFPLLTVASRNRVGVPGGGSPGGSQLPGPKNLGSTNKPASIADQQFPYRLRNSPDSMQQLARRDSAVLLRNALIDTDLGQGAEVPEALKSKGDPGSFVVQAKGFADEFFRAQVREVEAEVIAYIPNNAYLVRMNNAQAEALRGRSRVRAILPFEPYYKLDYNLLPLALGQSDSDASLPLKLGLFPGSADVARLELSGMGLEVQHGDRSPFGPVLTVDAAPQKLALIAGLSSVQSVEILRTRMAMNDRTRVRVGLAPDSTGSTNGYLGLNGSNVWVNVNDTGVDSTHRDLAGRVFASDPATLVDKNGHGTHVAGVIAGSGSSSTNLTKAPSGSEAAGNFRGVAPASKLFVQPVSLATGPLTTDAVLQESAARTNYVLFKKTNPMISNNSWGYLGSRDYDLAAASYDAAVRDALPEVPGAQPMIYVFAAGNSGFGNQDGTGGEPDGLISPATGKNVITVGALESRRTITNEVVVKDINDPQRSVTNTVFKDATDSDHQVASFSSRGNVGIGQEGQFGRFKPDVVAPGSFVVSTRSKGWTNVTSEPIPQVAKFTGQFVASGEKNAYVFFIPDNAVGFDVQILANPASPKPLPPLPIYVAYNRPPVDGDFLKDGQIIMPGDRALSPGELHFSIGNRTAGPVAFDLVTILTTTNASGTYFQELGKLNDDLAPSYRFDSGTSVSAGVVSGMLALMQQLFESNKVSYTPALMKALVINGAKSADSIYDFQVANTINYQGWGEVQVQGSLSSALASDLKQNANRSFVESGATNALATGQSLSWQIDTNASVQSALSGPLRLTLVWTDPPGNPNAAIKLVNDLDLVVSNTVTKEVFYGNLIPEGSDFTSPLQGGQSSSSIYSDLVNNVENVYVGHPTGNDYVVTVTAKRVNVNAVTAHTNGVVQDFALVASSGGQPVRLKPLPRIAPARAEIFYPTNGAPLLSQRAGANSPLLGGAIVPNNGVTNQWSFYVFTNVFSTNQPYSTSLTNGENVAFITFVPPNLSRPRNFDADIDLYVSRNPAITNLDTAALAGADRSNTRGGSETVVYTNAPVGPNAVFYIAVKSEDQQGAEYGFVALSSNQPFERTDEFGNRILTAMPPVVEIPDGSPTEPSGVYMFALGITPSLVQKVTVSAIVDHGNIGDLFGNLSHDRHFVVLNNHNADGGFVGPLHQFIFDDSNSGSLFGARPSDGPGSLGSFQGDRLTGAWIFSMVDNQLSHSGRVDLLELKIEPSPLDGANGVAISVLPNRFSGPKFIDVPADASLLEVVVYQATGPLNVYVRKDVSPTLVDYDKFASFNPPGGILTLGIRDVPPLSAGRYYIDVFNPSAVTANAQILFRIQRSLSQSFSKAPTVRAPIVLSDDVVQYATNVVGDARPLTDVRVGVRIDHARLSDLALRLISPQGKKILLMENRGGTSTKEIGTQSVTTNFQHVALTYDTNRGVAALYLDGEVAFEKAVGSFAVDTRDDLFIGRQPTTNQFSAPFVGVVDEVGVYNRALSPSEVRAIHRFGSAGKNSLGLAANWSFESNGNDQQTNNPVQIVGGAFVAGKQGAGLRLSSDAYARMTNSGALNLGLGDGFTVDAWINPADLSTNRTIVLWSNGTNRLGTSFSIVPGAGGAFSPGSLSATLVGLDGTNRVVSMEQSGLIQTNAVFTNFVFAVFNEDTNLASVPIKFAVPPYVTNAVSSSVYLGGFEVTATNLNTVFGTPASLDGWTVRSNQVSVLNFPELAHTGSNVLALARGAIRRTLPTEALHRYELKFVHRHQPEFEGIVAWWPGDRDASDLVGFSAGNSSGSVLFTNGVVGDAFLFPVPGAALSVPDNNSLRLTNELSIEFWFNRLSAATTSGLLFAKRTEAKGNDKARSNYGVDLDPTRGLGFWFDDPAVDALLGSDDAGSGSGLESVRVPLPSAGVFHHFVGTFKQTAAQQVEGNVYLDGRLVKTGRLSGSLANTLSDAPLVIGSLATNLPAYSVIVDEPTLFARALTPGEVSLMHSLASLGKCRYPCAPETQVSLDGNTPTGFFSSGDWVTNTYSFTAKSQGTPVEFSPITAGALLDSFEMKELFSKDYLPEETLKDLVGESALGIWRLEVTDSRVGPDLSGPPSELVAWQLLLTFAPTNYTAVTLTNGVTYSNLVTGGQSLFFIVHPPRSATRVTNTLGAVAPLDLVFNQNGLPTGGAVTGDLTLLRSTLDGISLIATNGTTQMDTNNAVLAASGIPRLQPGQRYYLGVRNAGADAPFSIRVDFDKLDPAISGLTELKPGQTVVTNIVATNALHYYRFNVAAKSVSATFGVYPTDGNVNLYIRKAEGVINPLPTPNQYDYASEKPGTAPEVITVDRNSVVPLTPGDWYLGVQNVETNRVAYSILVVEEAGSSTNVVRLLDSQEVAASTGAAFGLSQVYVYTASQDPTKLLFELYDLTANGDLVVKRGSIPTATDFDFSSQNLGMQDEQLMILTSELGVSLNGEWYLGVLNQVGGPIAYTIRAAATQNGVVTGGKPLRLAVLLNGVGGGLQLNWNSIRGERYRIESSVDLVQWNELTTLTATGFSTRFDGPPLAASNQFYRIIQVP